MGREERSEDEKEREGKKLKLLTKLLHWVGGYVIREGDCNFVPGKGGGQKKFFALRNF